LFARSSGRILTHAIYIFALCSFRIFKFHVLLLLLLMHLRLYGNSLACWPLAARYCFPLLLQASTYGSLSFLLEGENPFPLWLDFMWPFLFSNVHQLITYFLFGTRTRRLKMLLPKLSAGIHPERVASTIIPLTHPRSLSVIIPLSSQRPGDLRFTILWECAFWLHAQPIVFPSLGL
jgi:hypothetical protein